MSFLARIEALVVIGALIALPLCAQPRSTAENARVQHVAALGGGEAIEVEIQTSASIVPESQTITSPDRIVVDFPGALPDAALHSVQVNHGALKAIRTGLFSANPPITRVVLDLSEPLSYQIFAAGNKVILKLGGASGTSQKSLAAAAPSSEPVPAAQPVVAPKMSVNFQHGLLRIHAKGATLAEVLFEVQKQTGAEIPIPAGAEQEVVAVDIGPAAPRDALAELLNGSRYNFIFVEDTRGGSLQKAILSVR